MALYFQYKKAFKIFCGFLIPDIVVYIGVCNEVNSLFLE